jgi:hypothetical protein
VKSLATQPLIVSRTPQAFDGIFAWLGEAKPRSGFPSIWSRELVRPFPILEGGRQCAKLKEPFEE